MYYVFGMHNATVTENNTRNVTAFNPRTGNILAKFEVMDGNVIEALLNVFDCDAAHYVGEGVYEVSRRGYIFRLVKIVG